MKISAVTTSLLLALSGCQLANAQTNLNQAFEHCDTQFTTQTHYLCTPELTDGHNYHFSLVNAPDGMVIQPKTGIIKWTPLTHQVSGSSFQLTIKNNDELVETLDILVNAGEGKDPKGIYVSTTGNDATADGSAKAPFATLAAAAQFTKRHNLPLRIYIRGGVYQDFSSTQGSMLRIQDRHGEAKKWNFIRPIGNEYVKIESTRDVISVARSSYLAIENLHLDGMAKGVTIDKVMPYWWTDGRAVNPYKNRGLSANNSEHIRYSGNIIHDFSGGAISNNYNDHIKIEDNIVFRNAWWSTAGTHGISNSKTGNKNSHLTPNDVKYAIDGNLVFSNASLIASHVFSKGFVTLAVDEGNGIHLQNNHGTYSGHASVTNNLALYNGKAALGINTMDNILIRNNSFYHNGSVLRDLGGQGGELRLQSSTLEKMRLNLMHALPKNLAIKDSHSLYTNVNSNVVNQSAENNDLPSSVSLQPQVFHQPDSLDFTPHPTIATKYGVPQADLTRMMAKVKEYGIEIAPIPHAITPEYLHQMQQTIFDTWPSNGSVAGSNVNYEGLVLKAKVLNEQGKMEEMEYHYSQRCHFPNPPNHTACED